MERTMASNVELAERYLEDFNQRRYSVDNLRAYVAEDVVLTLPETGQEFHGHQGAIQFNESWVQPFSDAHVGEMTSVDRGEYVEVQFRGTGTFDGSIVTPQGTFKGDASRHVDLAFLNRFWIEDGKITRVEGHFDPKDMFQQMGLS
jgi:hypothetical protein